MDREQFLAAQLWLQRVSVAEWDGAASQQLLPPPLPSETVTAWCCFHVASRLCVFDACGEGEDATQLQLELRRPAPHVLLACFDGRLAFAVDLHAVVGVVAPTSVAQQQQQQQQVLSQPEAPPFGSLELPHVSVRVWLEPRDAAPTAARQMLQHALLTVQQVVARARQAAPEGSTDVLESTWRDIFRHSARATEPALPLLQLPTPAELLQRARRIFPRDADFEAAKSTCSRVMSASRRRKNQRENGADNVQQQQQQQHELPNHGDTFSASELGLLLTELAHVFGDTHDGVSELLGFSSGAACATHDRCFVLQDGERAESEATAPCVAAKWEAWDEYLEASTQALTPPRGSVDMSDALQAAARSFQRASTDDSDALAWQQRAERQHKQIRAFESVAFDVLFPIERQHKQQQQREAEQLLAVLLEKRKQLLRDELAFSLLPQRRQPAKSADPLMMSSLTAERRSGKGEEDESEDFVGMSSMPQWTDEFHR